MLFLVYSRLKFNYNYSVNCILRQDAHLLSLKCMPVNLSRFYGTIFSIFVLSQVGRSLKFNLSNLNASVKAQPTKLGFLRINPTH